MRGAASSSCTMRNSHSFPTIAGTQRTFSAAFRKVFRVNSAKAAALAINREDAPAWADEPAESNGVRTDVRSDVDDGIRRPNKRREKIKFLFRPFTVLREGYADRSVMRVMA